MIAALVVARRWPLPLAGIAGSRFVPAGRAHGTPARAHPRSILGRPRPDRAERGDPDRPRRGSRRSSPAYLLVVPLQYPEDSPRKEQVAVAVPLLEAVELAALRAGVPVDARIEKGRSLTHALRRLWEVERFERIVAPAPGFSAKDLAWILTHAPAETIVLRPGTAADAA